MLTEPLQHLCYIPISVTGIMTCYITYQTGIKKDMEYRRNQLIMLKTIILN